MYPANIVSLLLALVALAASTAAAGQTPIDTLLMKDLTRVLSHDSLLGRETATPGATSAARIIANSCRTLGLEPIGESFFHPVPLERRAVTAGSMVLTGEQGGRVSFDAPVTFAPETGGALSTGNWSGPAVFVGMNGDIPNYPSADNAGSIAVTLGLLGPEAASRLARDGFVAAVALIVEPGQYTRIVESRRALDLVHTDPAVSSSVFPNLPTFFAGVEVARGLLRREHLAASLPVGLDAAIAISLTTESERADADNVHCVLAGASPTAADTAIVLSAHYDHLGVGESDAAGDSIFNGFSDNAAGVAMLLAIAESLRAEPTNRSVVLSFFVGEERGLLGSDYHVANPPWPLDRVSGVVNLDAGAPAGAPTTWRIAGGETSLAELARDVGARAGWEVSVSGPRANSDYYPFLRRATPAIFIIPGPGPYDGMSQERSDSLKSRWDNYHRADDEWHPDFPFAGLARYADYARRVLIEMDRSGIDFRSGSP